MIGHTDRTHPMSCKSPMHVLGGDPLLSMTLVFLAVQYVFFPESFCRISG